MCLVSFIPLADGFVLSSNRDESPLRDAQDIISEKRLEDKIYYPKDPQNGSWIVVSEKKKVICLLNGAFKIHKRNLPYRKSRGLVMKEFFDFENAVDFFQHYSLKNIEPFTMIIYEEGKLYELRWDGSIKHILELDVKQRYFWSSCTLYDSSTVQSRHKRLERNLLQTDFSDLSNLQEAHLTEDHEHPEFSLSVNLNDIVFTISHSQVFCSRSKLIFKYTNLLSKKVEEVRIG